MKILKNYHHLYSLLYVIGYVVIVSGCTKEKKAGLQEGYRPIYMRESEARNIHSSAPQEIKNAGKIYLKDNYIFINEINKGIHILDNTNPASPVKVTFINIPGNIDIAVKNNILYADNTTDLVAIDISDPNNTKVVKRIENIFPLKAYPEERNIVFECYDKSKGPILGWEKAMLSDPQCYR